MKHAEYQSMMNKMADDTLALHGEMYAETSIAIASTFTKIMKPPKKNRVKKEIRFNQKTYKSLVESAVDNGVSFNCEVRRRLAESFHQVNRDALIGFIKSSRRVDAGAMDTVEFLINQYFDIKESK